MHSHQPMMEPDCDLIRRMGRRIDPGPSVEHDITYGACDAFERNTEIRVSCAVPTGPRLHIAEHPPMKLAKIGVVEQHVDGRGIA
jgi:hypothetical protein